MTKIVLAGGGTLGSVAPLVAVWQAIKKNENNVQVLFIGTKQGPEKEFLSQYPDLEFKTVPAGKLRRYFSLLNIFSPLFIVAGFIKALFILIKFKPLVIISAGGFVAVPIIFAGKILRIKVLIHQLDITPTLSNILVKGLADKITTTFIRSLKDFFNYQPVPVGSLIRQEAKNLPKVSVSKKVILFLGGGTGAKVLNELAAKAAELLNPEIEVWQIIGTHKADHINKPANYKEFNMLTTDYYEKLSQSSLVISRAGLSSLMELSYLAKPAIIVPIPNSHQEKNADYFAKNQAAIIINQAGLTGVILTDKIKSLLQDTEKLAELSENINKIMEHGGEEQIAKMILEFDN